MKDADKFQRAFSSYLVGEPSNDDEWRAYCPVHENPKTSKSPSASFNFENGLWHCASAKCGEGGSIRDLHNDMRRENVVDIKTKKPVKKKPLPTEKQVQFWHKTLLGRRNALKQMTEARGLSEETMTEFQIGWDGQRFTIPVRDAEGELVNIRRYKPNARSHSDKMVSWGVGHGSGRIFNPDVLEENDEVILTEGELDCIIGIQYGLPCVTHTSGSAVFKPEWAPLFRDKVVYVAYDEDQSGDAGAMKVAKVLKHTAKAVFRLKLGTGIIGGDLTDYFVKCGGDVQHLKELMSTAEPLYEGVRVREVPTEGKPVTLEDSQNVKHDGPLDLTVKVIGKVTPPFVAPKRIKATCNMNAGKICNVCPLQLNDGERTVDVYPDDDRLLKFINISDGRKGELYSKIVESKCHRHVTWDIQESYSLEELVVAPAVEERTERVENPMDRKVYSVGTFRTPVNQLVRFVGKQVPDPSTQRGVMYSWHTELVESDLEEFKMTPGIYRRLNKFKVKRGQTPLEKCMRIARDMGANVSQIYGREIMHVAYDLIWHSAIGFNFDHKEVRKGWLEGLILGTTRTGKSETAQSLAQHYRSGVVKSCESMSFAGLVGGARKAGTGRSESWMITWGLLPQNDRRLVVLDEMGDMVQKDTGILEGMSSIRSEGRAEVSKIAAGETSARTRMIWISNPINSRQSMEHSPNGCLKALRSLVKNPEDIARFDFVVAVSEGEVDNDLINSREHVSVRHRYDSDSCALLIKWAWSRTKDQIKWMDGAEDAVYEAAKDVGRRYVADPPLIQVANVRMKIARLAVAFAARTFSTGSKGENILVRKSHVQSAVDFLDTIYGSDIMGYARHSQRIREQENEARRSKDACRKYLKESPALFDVLQGIGGTTFRPRDFEEQGGLDREEANAVVKQLLQWKMIARGSQGRMEFQPVLNQLLKEMEDE